MGGVRAVISELSIAGGGRRGQLAGVRGDWVRQYRWAGDGWYLVGCSVVWAAWVVGVVVGIGGWEWCHGGECVGFLLRQWEWIC